MARTLKRKIDDDEKFEKERLKRREKRRKGDEATIAEAPVKPIVIPEKMSKRDKEKAKAEDMTDAKLRARTNATASMALGFGKKKKYSWMTGGDSDAPASGTSTPKTTAVAAAGSSGTATPAAAPAEDKLTGKKRTYGKDIEKTKMGTNIQIRDLVHVLENDGHERKTLSRILARLKNTEKDDEPADQRAAVGAGR